MYLQYAHARICSIIRKSNKDVEELKMVSVTFTCADFFNWFGAGLGSVLLSMSHEI